MFVILLVGDDMTHVSVASPVAHAAALAAAPGTPHGSLHERVHNLPQQPFLLSDDAGIAGLRVLLYLGFAPVYMVYITVKLAVILGAHCAVRWDEPLYKIKALHPLDVGA